MFGESFESFFQCATDFASYPYRRKLAEAPISGRLIHVPTGCGKTAALILPCPWQRVNNPERIPRRLVYCLPMRTLVEQTRCCALVWLDAEERLAVEVRRDSAQNGKRGKVAPQSYIWRPNTDGRVGAHVLMGGEESQDWDLYPESSAIIIIGTQDMLLSGALNRGYAMSRYRWPMHFGLLNNDCLWIFDEIQLMGSGLATTAQLEAFRATAGGNGCRMSATLRQSWLKTVDYADQVDGLPLKKLQAENADADLGDNEETRRTKDKFNRARELYTELTKLKLKTVLIHSRFRPEDRTKQISRLLAEPDADRGIGGIMPEISYDSGTVKFMAWNNGNS